jgi:carbonic anhydrase
MTTRREFLGTVSAAGVLLATSSRSAHAETAVMTKESQANMTPDQALAALKEGNQRFVSGKMMQRDLMAQVKTTATGQYPIAAVLGCIDSRVPPEIVFDQGLGDIFSARIAGNFANTDIIGSFEFATKLSGAKLIVVLGHTDCGAVKGACDNAQLGNLTATLSHIAPAVYVVTDVPGERTSKNAAFVQHVADANVRLTVQALTERSAVLRDLVDHGQLKVVGAMYDLASGQVHFTA